MLWCPANASSIFSAADMLEWAMRRSTQSVTQSATEPVESVGWSHPSSLKWTILIGKSGSGGLEPAVY
jgi:hypothetical protein